MENLTVKELTQLNKKVVHVSGKVHYFIGINNEGENVYLTEAIWNRGWYWGFGYITTFSNNKNPELSRYISSHRHWDSYIIGKHEIYSSKAKAFVSDNTYIYHSNQYFGKENSPLTDKESWTLAELMKSFYTLKETAEVLAKGSAHVTDNPCKDIIKNTDEAERIIEVVLPAIFEKIYELLTPSN